MIYRLVIYRKDTNVPKHSYWWREGDTTVNCWQHANSWLHPQYPFDMMLCIVGHSIKAFGDKVFVFWWDSTHGHWWDLE